VTVNFNVHQRSYCHAIKTITCIVFRKPCNQPSPSWNDARISLGREIDGGNAENLGILISRSSQIYFPFFLYMPNTSHPRRKMVAMNGIVTLLSLILPSIVVAAAHPRNVTNSIPTLSVPTVTMPKSTATSMPSHQSGEASYDFVIVGGTRFLDCLMFEHQGGCV
jgi:hypothetical protein